MTARPGDPVPTVGLGGSTPHMQLAREQRAHGVAFRESVYRGESHQPTHRHAEPTLCLVLEGGFLERTPERWWRCAAGSVLLRHGGVAHEDLLDDARTLTLVLEPGRRLRAGRDGPAGTVLRSPRLAAALLVARERMDGTRRTSERAARDVERVARTELGLGVSPEPPAGHWLAEVGRAVRRDPGAPHGLLSLARLAGVHPVHLATTHRRLTGRTVGELVRHERVLAACRSLARGASSLADLAVRLGFTDQSHLCRTFQRATGLTPSSFRRLASAP